MTQSNINKAICLLSRLLFIEKKVLMELAIKHSMIPKRKRTFDWMAFIYVSVFGAMSGLLKHNDRRILFNNIFKVLLTPNAFSDRLSQLPTGFLRDVIALIKPKLNYIKNKRKRKQALKTIERILIEDGSIFSLNKKLLKILGKSSGKGEQCSMKLFLGINIFGDEYCNAMVTNGKIHDSQFCTKPPKNTIEIRDRAWFSMSKFLEWRENQRYFISRVKENFNPLIVKVNKGDKTWEGKNLESIYQSGFQGTIKLIVQGNPVKGKILTDKTGKVFQIELWGQFIEDKWYWYILELPSTSGLNFNDIHQIYRLRWSVEESFREIKQTIMKGQISSLWNEKCVENQLYIMVIAWLILKKYVNLIATTHKLNPHGYRLDCLMKGTAGPLVLNLIKDIVEKEFQHKQIMEASVNWFPLAISKKRLLSKKRIQVQNAICA